MSGGLTAPVPSRVIVVSGPTATGKSELGLALAERFSGEIIGADSVQVYRGFDVGSAKPSIQERARAPHHLIDVLEPNDPIDAAGYARMADEAIRGTIARGHLPIIVGGTGLWLRALLRGLVELPTPDPSLRARLQSEVDALGAPALHARLKELDPKAALAIHPNDALRIVRALEVFEQTGTPIGELRAQHALGAPRYDAMLMIIDRPRDELYARIDQRIDSMMANGFAAEVRSLHARFGADARGLGAVGYREVLDHVLGRVSLEDAIAMMRKSTRVYTRRQRTWWGNEPGVSLRLMGSALDDSVAGAVEAFLSAQSRA